MLMVHKARAHDKWLGIFYFGWIQGYDLKKQHPVKAGWSISFGKLTYLISWR